MLLCGGKNATTAAGCTQTGNSGTTNDGDEAMAWAQATSYERAAKCQKTQADNAVKMAADSNS